MAKKYRSNALGALHETVCGLHRIGLVNTKTMHDFDASCLRAVKEPPAKQVPEAYRRARASHDASFRSKSKE